MNMMSGSFVAADQSDTAIGAKWAALHDAAGVVAMLGGMASEPPRPDVLDFPGVITAAGGWRLEQTERGIDDLFAIMEPGLAALLAVNARGVSPSLAALALWQEFQAARAALLALVPPPAIAAPHQSI